MPLSHFTLLKEVDVIKYREMCHNHSNLHTDNGCCQVLSCCKQGDLMMLSCVIMCMNILHNQLPFSTEHATV